MEKAIPRNYLQRFQRNFFSQPPLRGMMREWLKPETPTCMANISWRRLFHSMQRLGSSELVTATLSQCQERYSKSAEQGQQYRPLPSAWDDPSSATRLDDSDWQDDVTQDSDESQASAALQWSSALPLFFTQLRIEEWLDESEKRLRTGRVEGKKRGDWEGRGRSEAAE